MYGGERKSKEKAHFSSLAIARFLYIKSSTVKRIVRSQRKHRENITTVEQEITITLGILCRSRSFLLSDGYVVLTIHATRLGKGGGRAIEVWQVF